MIIGVDLMKFKELSRCDRLSALGTNMVEHVKHAKTV